MPGWKLLPPCKKKLADVNGDGAIDAADSRLIERYVAKLETKFPADKNE
ncbi:MAG: dockerin type I domain-containing protein [Oscillospiraceae bacterium]|nr:dockerin type I domain-containing protein [Oscillospiraceae bacterium]